MRAILNSSVPVPITYSSTTIPDFHSYDKLVQTGLALRILHSFFVRPGPDSLSIERLRSMLEPAGATLTAEMAVRICLQAAQEERGSKCGIVLLVDEIVKLARGEAIAELLSLLGRLLDLFSPAQLNIVVTTLDAYQIVKEETASGRKIIWAPLPALGQEAAEALITQALRRPPAAPGLQLPLAVRIAISDAAGHPRTLQYVLEAAWELAEDRDSLAKLRENVIAASLVSSTPSFSMVQAALRGVPCLLSAVPIAGNAKALRDLIADGAFINTDAYGREDALVVPKLSMFRLLQFAEEEQAPGSHAAAAATCIQHLAREEADAVASEERATLAGAPFENFVARWLQLMTILRGKEKLTALKLFHAEALDDHGPSTALTSTFKLAGVAWKGACPRHLSAALSTAGDLTLTRREKGLIRIMGDSNPAFDVLMTAPGVALAVEARFSEVGARTVDEDFTAKVDMFNGASAGAGAGAGAGSATESVRSLLQRIVPAPEHIIYVYCAAREVEDAVRLQQEMCKRGVILLSNDPSAARGGKSLASMQKALSPTLADRAFFLLRLSSATT